jgi:hypothetical protein
MLRYAFENITKQEVSEALLSMQKTQAFFIKELAGMNTTSYDFMLFLGSGDHKKNMQKYLEDLHKVLVGVLKFKEISPQEFKKITYIADFMLAKVHIESASSSVFRDWASARPKTNTVLKHLSNIWSNNPDLSHDDELNIIKAGRINILLSALHVPEQQKRAIVDALKEALQLMEKSPLKNIQSVLHGDIAIVPYENKQGDLGGEYILKIDTIYIYYQTKEDLEPKGLAQTLIHEIGHRYYTEVLTEKQQAFWGGYYTRLIRARAEGDVAFPKVGDSLSEFFSLGKYYAREGDNSVHTVPGFDQITRITSHPKTGQRQFWFNYNDGTEGFISEWTIVQSNNFPTMYAVTNDEEFFCETFALYIRNALRPSVKKALENVFNANFLTQRIPYEATPLSVDTSMVDISRAQADKMYKEILSRQKNSKGLNDLYKSLGITQVTLPEPLEKLKQAYESANKDFMFLSIPKSLYVSLFDFFGHIPKENSSVTEKLVFTHNHMNEKDITSGFLEALSKLVRVYSKTGTLTKAQEKLLNELYEEKAHGKKTSFTLKFEQEMGSIYDDIDFDDEDF